MAQPGYKQFCPVAMAAEALCARWTMVLRELVAGTTRLNDLRRGVPKQSLRNLNPSPLPRRQVTIQFLYPELPRSGGLWWLIVEPDGEVDPCWTDPGFEVDLHVSTDLHTMTSIWMGYTTVARKSASIALTGGREIARDMQAWPGLSPFAAEPRRAPA